MRYYDRTEGAPWWLGLVALVIVAVAIASMCVTEAEADFQEGFEPPGSRDAMLALQLDYPKLAAVFLQSEAGYDVVDVSLLTKRVQTLAVACLVLTPDPPCTSPPIPPPDL